MADANVLFSRSLRDYLLVAGEEDLISVVWSNEILDEMARNLVKSIPGFTSDAAGYLLKALVESFPYATFTLSEEDYARLKEYDFPDEKDRHVFAAALASEANVICTSNIKDFPAEIAFELGLTVRTPDALFVELIEESPLQMLRVHKRVVRGFPDGTNESTLSALRRAGANETADLLFSMLKS